MFSDITSYLGIFSQPFLNTRFNYRYIPQQIIALKCFLAVQYLLPQYRPSVNLAPGTSSQTYRQYLQGSIQERLRLNLFFLLTSLFILPYISAHLIWNAIMDIGVVFSYSYVVSLYILHEQMTYTIYSLILFCACLVSKWFEVAFDLYIIVVAMRKFYLCPNSEKKNLIFYVISIIVGFYSCWWVVYTFCVYFFLAKLNGEVLDSVSPIGYFLTMFALMVYRLLGSRPMYI